MKINIFNIKKAAILIILLTASQMLKAQCSYSYNGPIYISFSGAGGTQFVYIDPEDSWCHPASTSSYENWVTISYDYGNRYSIICSNNTGASRQGTVNVGGISLTVYQDCALSGGSISGPAQICYNTTGIISNTVSPSGCPGTTTYQWQSSTNGSSWNNIPGATGLSYSTGPLTSAIYFRRVAFNGSRTAYSNTVHVLLYPVPGVSMSSGRTSVCYGESPGQFSVSVSPSGSYSYQWRQNDMAVPNATSSTYTPGGLTTTTTLYCVVKSSTCNYEVASPKVTINVSNPVSGTISGGTTPICSGTSPGTLTAYAAGGLGVTYTYQWFKNGTAVSGETANTYSPGSLTANTPIYCRISSSSCGSANTPTKTITVNPLPTASAGSNSPVCAGQTLTLTSTEGTGYTYSWIGPNGPPPFSTIRNPVRTGVTAAMAGNYTVTITNSYGCSKAASTAVTVNAIPTTPVIQGESSACPNTTVTYSTRSDMTNYYWTLTGNNGDIISERNKSSVTVRWDSPGTGVLSVTYKNSAGCSPASAGTLHVTVNNAPVPEIEGLSTVCQNSSVIYSTTSSMSDYEWTVYGATATGNGNSITVFWGQSGQGSVRVNYTNQFNCRASSPAVKPVTINAIPVTPTITGEASVCQGTTQTYTTAQNMTDYVWNVNDRGTIVSGENSHAFTVRWANSGAGSLSVTYKNSEGCPPPSMGSKSVTVNAIPVTPVIQGEPSVCLNSSVLYSTEANMKNYQWTITGGTISSGGGTNDNNVMVKWGSAGTGQVSVNYSNQSNCPAATPGTKTITINSLYKPPVSGLDLVCVNTTETYTADPGMSSYTWTVINGQRTAGGTTSDRYVTVLWDKTGTGHVKVSCTSQDMCIDPGESDKEVVIKDIPVPTIGSNSPLCTGGTIIFQSSGGTSYQWTGPNNFSSSGPSSGISIPNATAAMSGTYTVTVSNAPQCSASLSTTVVVNEFCFSLDKNFIFQKELNTELTDAGNIYGLPHDKVRNTISYFDGLGRLSQTININASPLARDIITPVKYDKFGRERYRYLPFATATTNNDAMYVASDSAAQRVWHNSLYPGEKPYAETVFEASQLDRVLKQGAPGNAWQPNQAGEHVTHFKYGANKENEVLIWTINGENAGRSGGCYPKGKLYKNIVKDENWVPASTIDSLLHTTEEFTDLAGKVILKRRYVKDGSNVEAVNTYYIYNDLGLLKYVLSPETVKNLGSATTLTPQSDTIKQWGYYYRYDSRRRLIEKQLPGAGPVYFAYDKRDRLVAMQDGEMRTKGHWMVTKYDALNRPVITGIYASANKITQEAMQAEIDTFYDNPANVYHVSPASPGTHGYNTASFPGSNVTYYTITYFDNYSYPGAKAFNTADNISGGTFFDNPRSLVTGRKTLALDSLATATYMVATTYYDGKYRPIQTIRDLYEGGSNSLETVSNKYDFIGQLLRSKVKQTFNSATSEITKIYAYDHAGRVTTIAQKIGSDSTTMAKMQYNETGQLTEEKLHVTGSTALQTVNYKYNIRGWLTDINDVDNKGADLFATRLLYNSLSGMGSLTAAAQYNGNIAAIKWKSGESSGAAMQAYGFSYDALDRLKAADYADGASLTANHGRYNESIGSYDLNGNIISLTRSGFESPVDYPDYDVLSYRYNGNQLTGVEDAGQASGFNDRHTYSTSAPDYEYDDNGNMKKDLNKGLTTIEYNYLNLPLEVRKDANNKVVYIYDAIGNKLKKSATGGGTTTHRYYAGEFEYGNTKALELIHTDEGVVNKNGANYEYEYFLKDHLGSTRVTFKPNGSSALLRQMTDYYPFGMVSSLTQSGTDNKYLFGGKELQDEQLGGVNLDWYDFDRRANYDPQLGRFHSIDPLMEWHFNYTPYHYTFNNPINFCDPFGLDTIPVNEVNWPNFNPEIDIIEFPEVTVASEGYSWFGRLFRKIGRAINSGGNSSYTQPYGEPWTMFDGQGQETAKAKIMGPGGNIDLLFWVNPNAGPLKLPGTRMERINTGLEHASGAIQEATSDRQIVERSTGTAEKTDAHGRPIEENEYDYRTEGKESDSIIETRTVYFDKEKGNIVRDWKLHKETHDGRPISKKYRRR